MSSLHALASGTDHNRSLRNTWVPRITGFGSFSAQIKDGFPQTNPESSEPFTPNVEYLGYKNTAKNKTKNDNIGGQKEGNVLQRKVKAKVEGVQGTDQR